MKRVDVAYTLLLDSSKESILMVRNKRGNSFDYSLPGGAVEEGESIQDGAIREAKEETGLHIEVHNLLSVNEALFEEEGHHCLFFTFYGSIISGDIEVTRPHEIEDVVWMSVQEADKAMPYFPGGISRYIGNQYAIPYVFEGKK
ncbi:NUDIX hydrolase [Pontibacillus salicampi]